MYANQLDDKRRKQILFSWKGKEEEEKEEPNVLTKGKVLNEGKEEGWYRSSKEVGREDDKEKAEKKKDEEKKGN